MRRERTGKRTLQKPQEDLRETEPTRERAGGGGKDAARFFPPGPSFLKLNGIVKGP